MWSFKESRGSIDKVLEKLVQFDVQWVAEKKVSMFDIVIQETNEACQSIDIVAFTCVDYLGQLCLIWDYNEDWALDWIACQIYWYSFCYALFQLS